MHPIIALHYKWRDSCHKKRSGSEHSCHNLCQDLYFCIEFFVQMKVAKEK